METGKCFLDLLIFEGVLSAILFHLWELISFPPSSDDAVPRDLHRLPPARLSISVYASQHAMQWAPSGLLHDLVVPMSWAAARIAVVDIPNAIRYSQSA